MEGDDRFRDTRIRTTQDGRRPRPSSSDERCFLEAGATVGRYLILDVLGAGGMSVVYGAYDPQLDRRVALKLVRPGGDGRDSAHVRDRLVREGQALARLSHPNVVAVHDVGTVGDQVFVAMEYVEGRTLTEWLSDGPDRRALLRVFRAAGQGLAAAHAGGLVHRDFKPDNVMIDADGRVRVMDFGLARPSGAPSSELLEGESEAAASNTASEAAVGSSEVLDRLTVTGAVLGTPAYMAPEQHGGGRTGPATDQFAFCVALYEALYGRPPFEGNSRAELRRNVLRGRVHEPPRGRGVPRRLRQALLRGLAIHPSRRWPAMSVLLAELEPALREPSGRLRWLGGLGLTGTAGLVVVGLTVRPADSEPRVASEAPACEDVRPLEAARERWATAEPRVLALRQRVDELSRGHRQRG